MSGSTAESHAGKPVGRLAPLRVFLVEDSPLLCERISESITDPGRIEVVGKAASEASAIRGIASARPDVVIIDIRLREGNGLNVLRSVTPAHPLEVPTLIMLTNYAVPEYAEESLGMGADYFFDKATEFDRVGAVLQELAADRRRSVPDR